MNKTMRKIWKKAMAAMLSGVLLCGSAASSVSASAPAQNLTKEEQIKTDYLEFLQQEYYGSTIEDELKIEDIDLFKFYKLSDERIFFSAMLKGWLGPDMVSKVQIADHTFVFSGGARQPSCFLYWENGEVYYVKTAYEAGLLSDEDINEYYIERGSAPASETVRYEDVDWLEDWFADYAYTAYRRGLMTGLDETAFAPYELLSRAQLVTILDRMDLTGESVFEEPFEDVVNDDWYFNSVAWAYQNGIIKGYDEDTFGPTDIITREHMAVMLYRYAQYKDYDVANVCDISYFTDADSVSDCAETAIKWCVANGIINGKQGALDPQGTATRAECAAMISRFGEAFSVDTVVTDITGQEIADYAEQFVGNPYIWGGNSLTNGIDECHFVYQVLKNCGVYDGSYVTCAGWQTKGTEVSSLEEAQAGDVICYSGHVAIYDGHGGIIEAKGLKWGITHDRSADHSKISAIRRFV